jgi:hypothetical protein
MMNIETYFIAQTSGMLSGIFDKSSTLAKLISRALYSVRYFIASYSASPTLLS